MRIDPIPHRTVSEVCPLLQAEAATHTIPLLINSQCLAAIQACMREFALRILERGTQGHFQIMFFRAETRPYNLTDLRMHVSKLDYYKERN